MLKLIDTHAHLDIFNSTGPSRNNEHDKILLDADLETVKDVFKLAEQAGVYKLINVGCNLTSSLNSVKIAKNFPNIWATVGIHPCDLTSDWKSDLAEIKKLTKNLSENKIIGIGEIGLDFYHQPFDKQRQIDAFRAQIELALELNLPMSIHIREAGDQALRTMEEYAKQMRATIHCFQQNWDFAQQVLAWNFLVGIDGPIDYPKNDELRSTVEKIGLNHIILETDTPFLPPQKLRGQRNSPANLTYIVERLAQIFHCSSQEVAALTTANAENLFKI